MVRLAILLVDDMASAEDVVQEAFAGLYRNWGGLRDRNAAIGYLRTAVVNGSRSMLRRRRTARAYVPPDPGTARSAESLAMLSTEHQAVVSALGDLAPRQREVLVLRYYGGLSEAEIAEATGLSKGTVKSTASRAVAKLGDIMRARRTLTERPAIPGRAGRGRARPARSRCCPRRCGRWRAAATGPHRSPAAARRSGSSRPGAAAGVVGLQILLIAAIFGLLVGIDDRARDAADADRPSGLLRRREHRPRVEQTVPGRARS